jgi:tripartite-type tricarboxylate transporter receptor subunit TctC
VLSSVPYRARRRIADLVGGHIAWSAQTVIEAAVRAGTLRGIAVTAKERMADYPDTPTFTELGHPEFNSPIWFSLSAPKGLPAPILQKMNTSINKIMTAPRCLSGCGARAWWLRRDAGAAPATSVSGRHGSGVQIEKAA